MWTQQAVETLRKLALEGRSAAWIAVALGAPSRNAVIGKATRIGVRLNGGTGSALIGDGSRPVPPPPESAWRRTPSADIGDGPRSERPPSAVISLGKGGFARAKPRSGHSRGKEGRTDGFSPPPRWGRCGGSGSRRSARSSADGRSAIRHRRTSPIAVFRSPHATRIAPATVGSPIGLRTRRPREGISKAGGYRGRPGSAPPNGARSK